jgi:hypothetical protein
MHQAMKASSECCSLHPGMVTRVTRVTMMVTQGERVMKHIFIMCRVSAKTEFRRWRLLTVKGFPIFNISTKKLQ